MSNHPPSEPDDSGSQPPDRRNELAIIRTDLANERTLLSYSRTSLMMAGTGGTIMKIFQQSTDMLVFGILLIVLGAVIFVVGVWRFRMHQKRIFP